MGDFFNDLSDSNNPHLQQSCTTSTVFVEDISHQQVLAATTRLNNNSSSSNETTECSCWIKKQLSNYFYYGCRRPIAAFSIICCCCCMLILFSAFLVAGFKLTHCPHLSSEEEELAGGHFPRNGSDALKGIKLVFVSCHIM